MSKEPSYITVVFEVRDRIGFEGMADTLRKLFLTQEESVGMPYTVELIGNKLDRIELIEQAIKIPDYFYKVRAISEILRLPHKNTYELGLEVIKSWSDDE